MHKHQRTVQLVSSHTLFFIEAMRAGVEVAKRMINPQNAWI